MPALRKANTMLLLAAIPHGSELALSTSPMPGPANTFSGHYHGRSAWGCV